MIPKEDAWVVLDAAASRLKSLTYKELALVAAELPSSPNSEWREWQQATINGQNLHIDVLIGEWGLLRRRISVEVVANSDDGTLTPAVIPCVYFERFKSGRLYIPRTKTWEIAIFKTLSYVFVSGIAFVVVALVWYLFVRSK